MTKEIAIHNLFALKLRSRVTSDREALDMAIKALEQQQKTGHWIRQTDNYHDYYECEQCGIAVGLDDIKNYCPNCGARMGVEE